MAHEDRYVSKLHPEDLRNVIDATRDELRMLFEKTQQSSTPTVPAGAMVGRDAETFARAIRDQLEPFRRDLMRDVQDIVREATKEFLPDDDIEKRIEDRFADIGLPVDKDHKEATGQSVRGILKWQKRFDQVIAGMIIAGIGSALVAIGKMMGINIPTPGGH